MSKIEKDLDQQQRKVVITPEDATAAFEFWKQFNITPIPGLAEAFDAFCNQPTFENQENLKYMVCKAIATTQHECFTEENFAKVAEECAETAYEMGFKRDFENTIGE
jgi:hypothetical protein